MSFDFDAAVQAPFRMQPGLRRLAAGSAQLTPVEPGDAHLRAKIDAFGRHPERALLVADGFDPVPAVRALAGHAAAEHPRCFGFDGGTAAAHRLGIALHGAEVHADPAAGAVAAQAADVLRRLPAPWRLAALVSLAFAEDFAILDGASVRVPWIAVALPSHWAPEDKVGRHFAEVHAPVADNTLLVAAADALARLVSGRHRWERFVWTVTPQPRLNAHPALAPRACWTGHDPDGVAEQAYWRTERQTFLPVQAVQQAVFTIRVELQPLREAIDTPARARRLHDALASMSPQVLQYRGLHTVRDALLRWLAARAALRG
jgi:hypothetical protein